MTVGEAERDLGVDPRLLQTRRRRELERPRRGGDHGRRLERHRFDPQQRAVRACQLTGLGGALEQLDRRSCCRTRLDHPVQRPQRRGEHVQGAPVRVRAQLPLGDLDRLGRRAQRLLHPPFEVLRARESHQQLETLVRVEVGPEAQRPLELRSRLAQRTDAFGVCRRQRAEAACLGRQPRPLRVVRQPRMVLVLGSIGERRQHPGMQRRATRRGDRRLDRLAGELVAEYQLATVLDQHAARERALHRPGAARSDRGEQRGCDPLADHRRRVDHATRVRVQAPDPRDRRVAHRRWQSTARRERLHHQERIAARQARELAPVDPR